MQDIVAKIQQGNWTDADVSEAVAEILRLRGFLDGMTSWLKRNASAENNPVARAAFVEAHNVILKIKQEGAKDA